MVKLKVLLLLLPIAYGSAVWDTGIVSWFGVVTVPYPVRVVWLAVWAAIVVWIGRDAERDGRRTLSVGVNSPMPR